VPQGIAAEQIADQPHVVDEAIWEFEKSFIEALGIVARRVVPVARLRTGIVVALSVPLVLGSPSSS
jgi:multidrug efflux pump subunit AcrB